MAKVEIKNVKSVIKSIETALTKPRKQQSMYEKIVRFSVDRIRQESRKGKFLGDPTTSIQGLSDGTIGIRKLIESGRWQISPGKPSFFRATKSQVTMSGQLLDSLSGKINVQRGTVSIGPRGKRTPVKIINRRTGLQIKFKNQKEILSNESLAEDLAGRGFKFLGFDRKGVERVRRIVLDEIRRSLKKRR